MRMLAETTNLGILLSIFMSFFNLSTHLSLLSASTLFSGPYRKSVMQRKALLEKEKMYVFFLCFVSLLPPFLFFSSIK